MVEVMTVKKCISKLISQIVLILSFVLIPHSLSEIVRFYVSVVPADRKRLQADETVWVSRQLDGVPIQPHTVQVGSYVVAGVAFAEHLVCYS